MKTFFVFLLVSAIGASPLHAARNCAPDKVMCGVEPRTYGCPPCPKHGKLNDAAEAEGYRQDLEGYRVALDKSLKDGEIGMDGYREGIKTYKGYIGSVRAASGK